MITAISSVKQNSNLSNKASVRRTNKVTFTGSPISLLKNEAKISIFADEAASSIGVFFKKLLGKSELPFSKKPLTANADLTHILPDGTPITIPMPEVHTAVTRVLDGANILNPDAADLAAKAADTADALSTKAALAGILDGANDSVNAVTSSLDAVAAKAGIVDALATGADAVATKADIVDAAHTSIGVMTTKTDAAGVIHDIIDGIGHIIDKLPL